MNGEHKTGAGETGNREPTQDELDREARERQDPANNPRMQAMAAIASKHEQAIEDQLAAEGLSSRTTVGEQPVHDTRTTVDPSPHEPARQTPTAAPATPAKSTGFDPQVLAQFGSEPIPAEALDSLKLRFKVNGEERVVTMHDLRREAQLDGAAHIRLQQANEIIRKAQEAAASGGKPVAPTPPVGVEGKPGAGDSSPASKDVTAEAKKLVQALFVGDEDAAVETVTNLLRGAQPAQQIDAATIARQVAPAVRQQLSQDEAEAQFRSEFSDIVKDPILVSAADQFFEEVMAVEPQKPYAEALAEAGKRTRDWLASRTGTPATGAGSTPRTEKQAAKDRIDNVRALARTEVQVEQPIPSHSDVIAEMRKARGLS